MLENFLRLLEKYFLNVLYINKILEGRYAAFSIFFRAYFLTLCERFQI